MSDRLSQRARILNLLIAAGGMDVPVPELARVSLQYNARVFELRRLGFRIESRVERHGKITHGFFRLVRGFSTTSNAPRAKQKLAATQELLPGAAVNQYPD